MDNPGRLQMQLTSQYFITLGVEVRNGATSLRQVQVVGVRYGVSNSFDIEELDRCMSDQCPVEGFGIWNVHPLTDALVSFSLDGSPNSIWGTLAMAGFPKVPRSCLVPPFEHFFVEKIEVCPLSVLSSWTMAEEVNNFNTWVVFLHVLEDLFEVPPNCYWVMLCGRR